MICRVCSSHFKMQLFYVGSQLDYGLPQSAPEQYTPLYGYTRLEINVLPDMLFYGLFIQSEIIFH